MIIGNESLGKMIDHTVLKPEATSEMVKKICDEALKYDVASVCINPVYVKYASSLLKNSNVKICTVIGFPLGANTSIVKAFEAEQAILDGATEVDMVINIGKLKDKDYDYVKQDIKAVVDKSKGKALTKVIIETCLLTDDEKAVVCKLAEEAGADFVKTSTGFSTGGATVEDVKLMHDTVGNNLKIKASGGIRSKEDALKMINAGAARLGTSATCKILE